MPSKRKKQTPKKPPAGKAVGADAASAPKREPETTPETVTNESASAGTVATPIDSTDLPDATAEGDGRVLGQDEIDALLAGMDGEEIEADNQATLEQDGVQPYDLTSQDRTLNIRLPGLDMLNERFARRFRVSLFNLLRCSVDLSARAAQTLTFSQFINRLPVPASLNIVTIKPLYGSGLFVLDAKLVFTLVDFYFGGGGRFPIKVEGRDFTPTEIGIVKAVLRQAFSVLSSIWSSLLALEFKYERSEQNPRFANILTPDEIVIDSAFEIDLEGNPGTFHILLPFSMLESVRETITTGYYDSSNGQEENETHLSLTALKGVQIDAICEFGVMALSIERLLNMQLGDILPLTSTGQSSLRIEGLPLIAGRAGMKNGNYAFQIGDSVFEQMDEK
jgi:flagellar motor switch protein FliM